jgi:diguanylate cyclase (GGDEF)-like protein/PAS domain S-box-containing protein
VVDEEGKIVFANTEARKNVGKNGDKLIGKYLQSNLVGSEDDEVARESLPLIQTFRSGKKKHIEDGLFWKSNGDQIPVCCKASPLEDDKGEIIGALVSLTNESEMAELKEELRYHKNHDGLTGLPNHLKFREELKRRINSDELNDPAAVFLIDIDRFKEVNNSLGLKAADELLTTTAELIQNELSNSDLLARFGGDEFIILSPDKDRNRAEKLATAIIRAIRKEGFKSDGTKVQATISMGYTLFPEQGENTDELLAKADMALSQAKRSGRNQSKIYDPAQDSQKAVKSRVGWVNQINSAIKENNFVLYAQPILELGSDDISHYEVLIRMAEGGGELISPGRFLPVAEKFGLSRDIDKWVVNETLNSLHETSAGGLDHQFAINLSGQSMTDNELLNWLKCNQSMDGKNFDRILFEVTETAALSNIGSANDFISALRDRGSKFALDDFGMGFSSFNYLKQLSVDYLKIDGSFIQDLPKDSMNQDLVQSIVEVAHRLQKETIAEFVEDEETLRMVRNYGTDHAQGFHIGRPQPLQSLL